MNITQTKDKSAFFISRAGADRELALETINSALHEPNDTASTLALTDTGALSDLSLLKYGKSDDGTPSINMHQLVQEVALGRLEEEHPKAFPQDLDAVLTRWPSGNDGGHPKYWPICRQLLAHALTLLDRFETIEVDLEKIARLQSYAGYYLSAVARYKEAVFTQSSIASY